MSTWPPTGPTTITKTIPAYLYWQHNDDPDLQVMTDAYNAYAQAYISWFNNLNLPVYTNGNIFGALLDWVLTNLYGFPRPGFPAVGGIPSIGDFNTYKYNSWEYNQFVHGTSGVFIPTTDDTYKRCATWLFYKGDGRVFTTKWLKRRVTRFLNFIAGTSGNIDNTYGVSVTYTGFQSATITIPSTPESIIFQIAVRGGVLELPFQINWTITLT